MNTTSDNNTIQYTRDNSASRYMDSERIDDSNTHVYSKNNAYNRSYDYIDTNVDNGDIPRKYIKSDMYDSRYNSDASMDGYKHTYRSYNKENVSISQMKKNGKIHMDSNSIDISMEEGQILLHQWEKNHFIDFNSWLQNAKAKVAVINHIVEC